MQGNKSLSHATVTLIQNIHARIIEVISQNGEHTECVLR